MQLPINTFLLVAAGVTRRMKEGRTHQVWQSPHLHQHRMETDRGLRRTREWFYARPHPNLLPRGEGELFHASDNLEPFVSITAFFQFYREGRKPL